MVVAVAAFEEVIAGASVHGVVAGAAVEDVVAAAAVESVVAGAALQVVVASVAEDDVVAVASLQQGGLADDLRTEIEADDVIAAESGDLDALDLILGDLCAVSLGRPDLDAVDADLSLVLADRDAIGAFRPLDPEDAVIERRDDGRHGAIFELIDSESARSSTTARRANRANVVAGHPSEPAKTRGLHDAISKRFRPRHLAATGACGPPGDTLGRYGREAIFDCVRHEFRK